MEENTFKTSLWLGAKFDFQFLLFHPLFFSPSGIASSLQKPNWSYNCILPRRKSCMLFSARHNLSDANVIKQWSKWRLPGGHTSSCVPAGQWHQSDGSPVVIPQYLSGEQSCEWLRRGLAAMMTGWGFVEFRWARPAGRNSPESRISVQDLSVTDGKTPWLEQVGQTRPCWEINPKTSQGNRANLGCRQSTGYKASNLSQAIPLFFI